ncbi:Cytochrome b5, partial [Thalictrum thalictroides]
MDLFDCVKKGDLDYIKTVTEDVILKARDKNGISVLSAATIEDKFDCCKEILKKCPSLLYLQDDSDSKYTVLHHATYYGSYVFIDYFLSVGLDAATNEGNMESREENMLRFKKWIKLKNKYADTALTQATYYHNLHIVKRLIEVDREYKLGLSGIVGRDRRTALQWAVEYQDHDIIKLLTDEGDPYSDYIPYSIAMDLFDHVKKGDLDYIKTVRSDVLLKARDEKGISVLSAATTQNKLDCCKEILKKCPSLLYLQEHSNSKFTVLHHATYYDNYMIIDYFLNVGLDAATNEGNMESREENMLRFKKWIKLKNSDADTALTQATYFGNLHIVKKLIEVDRECKLGLSEIVGRDRQTALQWAVKNQDHEMIKVLTDEGDPYSDYIPYSIAMDLFDHVKKGDLDYVKTVRSDVLLNSRDEERRSALCIATRYNQFGCCEEILKRCPILLYHQNNTKDTVLHHATYFRNGFYRLVDLFVGVGLDVATTEGNVESKAENMQRFKKWINLQNRKEDTALTQAAYNHNHDIVKRFLEVDRQYKLGLSDITGFDKKTPLQLALEYEDQEMIKLLTEGTDPDFKYGGNTDGNNSLWIATTQSDSAGVGLDVATKEGNIDRKPYMDLFDHMATSHFGFPLQKVTLQERMRPMILKKNTDLNFSIAMPQAQGTQQTGNISDTAGAWLDNIKTSEDIKLKSGITVVSDKIFTLAEVSKHNNSKDCWLVINGKVYDVTGFLGDHPGGGEILLEAT